MYCRVFLNVWLSVGGLGFVRLPLDVSPTGKSYSFRSCVRAGEAKQRACLFYRWVSEPKVFLLRLLLLRSRNRTLCLPWVFWKWNNFCCNVHGFDVTLHFFQCFVHGFSGMLCDLQMYCMGFVDLSRFGNLLHGFFDVRILSIYFFLCVFVCLCVCLYVCLSVCLFVCLSLSVCSICLFICLSVCLCVCLFVCLFVCCATSAR